LTKSNSIAFTELEIRETCKKCVENVIRLFEAANLLLNNNNTERYALGLYLYAVEEYGKAHLLKSCFTGGKNIYSAPRWIFGSLHPSHPKPTSHQAKLSQGFANLPYVCKKLSGVLEIRSNESDSNQRFVIKGELGESDVYVPSSITGLFEDPSNPPIDIESQWKTALFYIDWDEKNKKPKFIIPPVEKNQLMYNIQRALEEVNRFDSISW
jgi:AbiV family abortive infection protein